ncbi:MAG: hypothetical protein RR846_07160 [Oscillospiraceae bacterium]
MYNCIVNFNDCDVVTELIRLGYRCIPTIKSDRVSMPISCHADALYLATDEKNIIISSCQKENITALEMEGFTVTSTDILQPGYRTECGLNMVKCGGTLIYNPKTAISCDIFNNVRDKITVNQGYAKCSTIAINENAFITEDVGIYKGVKARGKDCLLLKKGFVKLDGYDCGFIGGASIMLKDSVLFFCGDINLHPQKNEIGEYLTKHNVTAHCIKNKPLTDVGGGIVF